MASSKTVEVLHLSDNNIGIAGVSVMANALSKSVSLKTLLLNKGSSEEPTTVYVFDLLDSY